MYTKGRPHRLPRMTKRLQENLLPYMKELREKHLQCLEIGVYRGDTSRWIYYNLLDNPMSHLLGIDPWEFNYAPRKHFPDTKEGKILYDGILDSLMEFQKSTGGKVHFIRGYSQDLLPTIEKNSYDFIYVDGHHTIHSVMRDYVLAWRILAVDGIMIFDDYKMRRSNEVQRTVDLILDGFGDRKRGQFARKAKIEILFRNNQVGIRKLRD